MIYKKMMSCIALAMMLLGVVAETMPPLPEGAFTFAVIPTDYIYFYVGIIRSSDASVTGYDFS